MQNCVKIKFILIDISGIIFIVIMDGVNGYESDEYSH